MTDQEWLELVESYIAAGMSFDAACQVANMHAEEEEDHESPSGL